ncbi:hypothetical protein H310_06181 [Aphanomyces invadans]|uniref:Uncharacterized protein n=1 Tax=Aphanomyces invadans TaxID=157072 RepID=A0A024U6K9_9STRA|nr:hypothetical protein H310_06181 [Aphanomyces invadans]ETW01517.1 hypothetical protein H310_06181 [Aphanomyces invadans]|eukprot:XP_008869365.1 hypothetical protein H310_06181 [Aphanomyces invadans]
MPTDAGCVLAFPNCKSESYRLPKRSRWLCATLLVTPSSRPILNSIGSFSVLLPETPTTSVALPTFAIQSATAATTTPLRNSFLMQSSSQPNSAALQPKQCTIKSIRKANTIQAQHDPSSFGNYPSTFVEPPDAAACTTYVDATTRRTLLVQSMDKHPPAWSPLEPTSEAACDAADTIQTILAILRMASALDLPQRLIAGSGQAPSPVHSVPESYGTTPHLSRLGATWPPTKSTRHLSDGRPTLLCTAH